MKKILSALLIILLTINTISTTDISSSPPICISEEEMDYIEQP